MEKIIAPFNRDKEKMRDFLKLSKADFLDSYNYINEESYDMTAEIDNA